MKPPDEIRREIVAQWLARADEDLSVARHLLAEKLPYHGAMTRDLGRLLDFIAPVDGVLATALFAAVQLTDYGVDVRYPGDLPQLDADDARQAVDCAVDIRDAITSRLDPANPAPAS
jgi:HEPN domain-containing protein